MNHSSPYLRRRISLGCSLTLQEWNTCEDDRIAALKKKYRHSWGGNLFHHCHTVPGVPHPWQITHQQPYSTIFQHNSTGQLYISSRNAAAVVGMEAFLSTQSHVPTRVLLFNHTNIQGSLIEQQVHCETGTKTELLYSELNTQTDELKLTKSSTERPKEKSMASPTKKKHAPMM